MKSTTSSQNKNQANPQLMHKFMSSITVRITQIRYNERLQAIFKIQTVVNDHNNIQGIHNTNEDKVIATLYRSLSELQALAQYIISQYGGHVVPIIHKSVFKNSIKQQRTRSQVQDYLQQLRECWWTSTDTKYYCFLFQQAMVLKQKGLYQKVLNNASKLSKKYLNSIFTRKQFPQHNQSQCLQKLYSKLIKIFHNEYPSIINFAQQTIMQHRYHDQILLCLSELASVPSLPCPPSQHLLIQTQKLIKFCRKYREQTQQAYQRWEILVQGVREGQHNVCKGLHEDYNKLIHRQAMLSKWTVTLMQDFHSMIQCFEGLIQKICQNIQQIRAMECNLVNQFQKVSKQQQKQCSQNEQSHQRLQKYQKQDQETSISLDSEPQTMNNINY